MSGYTEAQAQRLKERVNKAMTKARDQAVLTNEFVTDSSELKAKVNDVLNACRELELTAEEIIDRRISAVPLSERDLSELDPSDPDHGAEIRRRGAQKVARDARARLARES